MIPPPITSRLIHFGAFAVDPRSRELFSHGLRVMLQEQPFRVLLMLLEHCGDVVTREELRKALWPGDTFVDFDQGLNKAINKLRCALGDSAEHPRYIETLPKRGYRLIVPVKRVNKCPQFTSGAGKAESQPAANNGAAEAVRTSPWRRRMMLVGAASALRMVLNFLGFRKPLADKVAS
jgi:DNA-binding winged helix-turn-helix (wHTH) protein